MSQCALRSPGSRPVAFAPITFGPGMPLPESRSALAVSHDFGGFLRTRGAGLLHPAADHGVRLVSGSLRPFAPSVPEGLPGSFWKASAVSIPGDRQAGTRPPSGDWERTNPIPRRPGDRAAPGGAPRRQGWSERSPARRRSLRTIPIESSLRRSHPRRFRRLAKSARCHQPSCCMPVAPFPQARRPSKPFPHAQPGPVPGVPVLLPPRRCAPWLPVHFER